MRLPLIRTRSQQRGYILISTIIIVLLITLLALAGVSYNSTQTRVATNSKDGQIAFETAEAVLRQVSDNIASGLYAPLSPPSCSPLGTAAVAGQINAVCAFTGITAATSDVTPLWQTSNPPWTNLLPNGATTYQGNSFQPGQYLVEGLNTFTPPGNTAAAGGQVRPFRVTVEAWGAVSSNTTPQVMLQSIVFGPP